MYKFRNCFCGFFSFLSLALFVVTAQAGTVHLLNGDRVSGEIINLQGNFLTLDTEYADQIKIQRQKIKSIESESELTIHLITGHILRGNVMANAAGDMTFRSLISDTDEKLLLEQVIAINPMSEKRPKWEGNVNLGGNLSSGNTDKKGYSIGMDAVRKSARHRFSLELLFNYAKEEGELSDRNAYSKIKYDYFVSPRTYTYLSSEFLYDELKALNLRTVVGPGAGYQVWHDTIKMLEFEAGLAYFHEDLAGSEDDSWVTARLAANFRYKLFDKIVFTEQLTIFPSLTNTGEFTLRNETAISSPLAYGWALRLASIVEHDSDTEPGVEKTDLDLLLGLQYGF